jgi:hypothetical protein
MVMEKWSGDNKKTIIMTCPNTTNEEIFQQAETHYKEERLLAVGRQIVASRPRSEAVD